MTTALPATQHSPAEWSQARDLPSGVCWTPSGLCLSQVVGSGLPPGTLQSHPVLNSAQLHLHGLGPPPPPSYPSPTQGSPLLAGPPGLFPAPANRQPKLVLSACAPCTTAGDTHLWLRVLPLDTREQAGEGRGLGPPDTSLSLALGGPRRRGPGWVRERAPPWASPGMLGKGGDSTATSGGCSQAGSKDRGFLRFL